MILHPVPCTTYAPQTYYDEAMASVRLDPELESRLERAAAARGESKSDFIRAAIGERIEATLGATLADRLDHVVGRLNLGGGRAEHAGELVALRVSEAHHASLGRQPRQP